MAGHGDRVRFDCQCCLIPYRGILRPGADVPEICGTCQDHQGSDEEAEQRRREDHAQLHEKHFLLVRQAVARARSERDVAVTSAHQERDKAIKKMYQAYASRRTGVVSLRQLADVHERTGRQGAVCKCGKTDCPSLRILDKPWVRRQILILNDYEDQVETEFESVDERPSDEWMQKTWDKLAYEHQNPKRA